jgi:uncharacterized protein YqeY
MTLSEQIENDLKNALREKNEQLVSCLRMLKSSLKNQAIEARVPQLDDLQVMAVLKRELKKRQDSAISLRLAIVMIWLLKKFKKLK